MTVKAGKPQRNEVPQVPATQEIQGPGRTAIRDPKYLGPPSWAGLDERDVYKVIRNDAERNNIQVRILPKELKGLLVGFCPDGEVIASLRNRWVVMVELENGLHMPFYYSSGEANAKRKENEWIPFLGDRDWLVKSGEFENHSELVGIKNRLDWALFLGEEGYINKHRLGRGKLVDGKGITHLSLGDHLPLMMEDFPVGDNLDEILGLHLSGISRVDFDGARALMKFIAEYLPN